MQNGLVAEIVNIQHLAEYACCQEQLLAGWATAVLCVAYSSWIKVSCSSPSSRRSCWFHHVLHAMSEHNDAKLHFICKTLSEEIGQSGVLQVKWNGSGHNDSRFFWWTTWQAEQNAWVTLTRTWQSFMKHERCKWVDKLRGSIVNGLCQCDIMTLHYDVVCDSSGLGSGLVVTSCTCAFSVLLVKKHFNIKYMLWKWLKGVNDSMQPGD